MKNSLGYKTQRKEGMMSTLTYIRKLVRPTQVLIGALATYIVALLSNGPTWINQSKFFAPIVIALSIFSASIWHYGSRHEVYAKKWWDPVIVKNPNFLRIIGFTGFIISILISLEFLPIECSYIAIFNMMAIILYAKIIDMYWPWKNIVIALVCITPLILGWLSGHRLNPTVPFLIYATFLIYLVKEILKDVVDREANNGKRFTMVMHLGISSTLKIAGAILITSVFLIMHALAEVAFPLPVATTVLFFIGELILTVFSFLLLIGKDFSKKFFIIDIAVGIMLVGLLWVRVDMY